MDDGRAGNDVVVDYGLGNLRSVTRGLEQAGAGVTITDDRGTQDTADGIVLPGVGAFSEGMENPGPFRGTLVDAAGEGRPVFGIRLGMQMLLSGSEEADHVGQGDAEGLDIVPGRNVRFDGAAHGLERTLRSARSPLVEGVDGEYAYFIHSYYAEPDDDAAVRTTTDAGGLRVYRPRRGGQRLRDAVPSETSGRQSSGTPSATARKPTRQVVGSARVVVPTRLTGVTRLQGQSGLDRGRRGHSWGRFRSSVPSANPAGTRQRRGHSRGASGVSSASSSSAPSGGSAKS